jgi:hypothetical protein
MTHYVYKIIDKTTNEYYFGSRSCNCLAKDDVYMGSMKVWKPKSDNLIKEILNDTFSDRISAMEYESNIIKLHIKDSLNQNYHIPTSGFHTNGRKQSELERTNRSNHRIQYELSKGSNNAMYNKSHSLDSIKKMKTQAKNRYTKKWFIEKYGEQIGIQKYNEKGKLQSNKLKSVGNPMFGKSHTPTSKIKMSESKQKKVGKYNIKNEIIHIYSSITEAASKNNISISAISLVCDPTRINKTAGGFIWKFI